MEAAMSPSDAQRRRVRRTVAVLVVIAVVFYAGFIWLAAQRA